MDSLPWALTEHTNTHQYHTLEPQLITDDIGNKVKSVCCISIRLFLYACFRSFSSVSSDQYSMCLCIENVKEVSYETRREGGRPR